MSTSRGTGPLRDSRVVPLDERRPRRQQNRPRRQQSGSAPPAEVGVSMIVHAGVPVVTCDGHLDEGSVQHCLRVLSYAVSLRPRTVVVDLGRATVDQESAPVLRLMQHFTARHGIKLALAAVPPRSLSVLHRSEVAALCEVYATLPLATGAAVAQSHRSLPRRSSPRRQTGN